MNPETGRRYRLSVRVASDPSGGDWFGGHQDEWWREGWGSSYLWRSAPTLLIAGRGQRAYLGGVRGARVDAATGLETTYDLALTADPDGLISWREAASLIGTWWRQRHEPAAWPLGAALDRWDRTTAYASGVVSVRPTALRRPRRCRCPPASRGLRPTTRPCPGCSSRRWPGPVRPWRTSRS